jgi:hypothetical protein
MEPTRCWKTRWYWAWQDGREEAWLEEMSGKGWHLESFCLPGVYIFRKGQPTKYVYRLDFQTSPMKDRKEYLQLFRDAGWDHLGNMAAWEYFRKEALPGEEPEIFTDPESKIQKYRRILGVLSIFLLALIILFLPTGRDTPETKGLGAIPQCITAGALFIYIFGIVQIGLRIRELKKNLRK